MQMLPQRLPAVWADVPQDGSGWCRATHPLLNRPGYRVRTGEDVDLITVLPGSRGREASNAAELLDELSGFHSRPQSHGDRPARRLRLRGTPSCLAEVSEDLAKAALVAVHGDEERPATHPELECLAARHTMPWPRGRTAQDRRRLSLACSRQGLPLTRSIAVDRRALAPELEGQAEDPIHILDGGVGSQVHRFRDRVVRVFRKGRLHADMPFRGHLVGSDEDTGETTRDCLDLRRRGTFEECLADRLIQPALTLPHPFEEGNRKPSFTTSPSAGQSMSFPPRGTNLETSVEPRQQDSPSNRGCSPHGFVAVIGPRAGVGLSLLMRSMKQTPGSPVACALAMIRRST